jgi:replicative DNA helicase
LPGDLAVFLSDTGVGKTACLTNIAYSQRPIPTIFFELELSPETMCERFIARDTGVETLAVERRTIDGDKFDVHGWDHVFICPESRMTIEKMEEIIARAELKIQAKPRLILVDYVGLMGGGAGKRYERMSTIAEGMKILARTTGTVVIMASQVRRDPDRTEVDLHDARDSGAIENSAQLVMGAWRPDVDRMTIKLLKQTKRAGEHKIECKFDGHRQRITELAPERGML